MSILASVLVALSIALAHAAEPPKESPPRPPSGRQGDRPSDEDMLRRFDLNGDGKIDDDERRALREKMRARQNAPGARTPSGTVDTIGNRDVREMEYASSDGRKIPCVLSIPKGDGPFPVLVTIHGGQGDRDLAYIRTMAAPNALSPTISAFNEQPWAILAISYRAGNGALFGMEQDDVFAGIRFAKTLSRVDPSRIGVVGGSHGGHLALIAAERMGKELLCAAVGSPWMTDPFVYMKGDPATPPLSLVPQPARDELVKNGRALYNGLVRRANGEAQAEKVMREHSIEANAHKIAVPTLFITSRGDDQAPHALVEPTIERMKAAGLDVSVYTAEKSPHGFYWARTVSAARAIRGEKSAEEAAEEKSARDAMIAFFTKHFARTSTAPAPPRKPSAPAVAQDPGAAGNPAASAPQAASQAETVRLPMGELAGAVKEGVRVFRGVPYAQAPVGALRWKAPQPVKSWQGVRKAVDFGPPALQGEAFYPRDTQSEDCLTLNIWAPAEPKAGEKHPVLFWIHGGAFIQGSGAQPRYDGTELAKRGAIVVTINYRLGPLGLFAHPALSAEAGPTDALANFCLLDMIAALRWTRDNIAAFGGDPGNVTVSGSSAGGTSCLFLMGSPEARGLFHKAIIHSSGGMRNIKTLAEAEQAGAALAEQLGAGTRATAADLRRLDADDVAVSTQQIQQLGLPVKPVIDGRLVTHTPEQVFAQGKQARIPVLIGGANGESGARQFGDEVATGGAFGFQRQLADAMTRDGQKVYMFQMTFVPPQARATRSAALHGEPVAYAFGTIGMSVAAQHGFRSEGAATRAAGRRRGGGAGAAAAAVGGREDDSAPVEESTEGRRISEAMMDYFVAFMRTGKPEANGLAEWPAYSASAPKTMVFGNFGIGAK